MGNQLEGQSIPWTPNCGVIKDDNTEAHVRAELAHHPNPFTSSRRRTMDTRHQRNPIGCLLSALIFLSNQSHDIIAFFSTHHFAFDHPEGKKYCYFGANLWAKIKNSSPNWPQTFEKLQHTFSQQHRQIQMDIVGSKNLQILEFAASFNISWKVYLFFSIWRPILDVIFGIFFPQKNSGGMWFFFQNCFFGGAGVTTKILTYLTVF